MLFDAPLFKPGTKARERGERRKEEIRFRKGVEKGFEWRVVVEVGEGGG